MSSLSTASTKWDELRIERDGVSVEQIPTPEPEPKTEVKVPYKLESHIFNCVRYENEADKGFTDNLNNFLLEIIKSENVMDENLKIVAKAIMNNCIDHQIIKYTDEQIQAILKNSVKKANKTTPETPNN